MALESNTAESTTDDRNPVQRWVDAWMSAGPELEAIKRSEAAEVPVHEAIRQLFDGMESVLVASAPVSSDAMEHHGLVQQQMWFSRIRTGNASQASGTPHSGE